MQRRSDARNTKIKLKAEELFESDVSFSDVSFSSKLSRDKNHPLVYVYVYVYG